MAAPPKAIAVILHLVESTVAAESAGKPLDDGFVSFAAASCEDLEWREFVPLQNYLTTHKLEKEAFYGFLPADCPVETGLGAQALLDLVRATGGRSDVVLFAPHPDRRCIFASTLEETEYFVPGFVDSAALAYRPLLGATHPSAVVMDSRQAVSGNYFVAKPKFWRAWLAAAETIFALAKNRDSEPGRRINRLVRIGDRPSPVAVKVLLLERLASLLLATQAGWKVSVHSGFDSPLSTRGIVGGLWAVPVEVADLIALDALKLAYRERGRDEYLATFLAARRKFFADRAAPFAFDGPLDAAGEALVSGSTAIPTRAEPSLRPPPGLDEIRRGERSPAALATLNLSDLIALADELATSAGQAEVISLYREWIRYADSPMAFVAQFNLGHLLSNQGDLPGAEAAYRLALAQNPQFPQARLNLGSVLERLSRQDEAVAEWQRALEVIGGAAAPDTALLKHVLNNLGRVLELQHRYPEAEAMLTRSLGVQPEQDEVLHHWVHLRQKQCEWPVYSPLPGVTVEQMVRATSALAMLSASNDPAQQLATAAAYARSKIRSDLAPLAPAEGYAHRRLRVGYLSSNLNLHAVSILTAELYELHDRSRVEVFAFCWSPEDGTPMRARIRAAMDHLIRIDRMSDEQAAQAIRAAEIDILVDLQGLTSGCRPTILAHRPAPVQIAWLGFPGTTGLPGVDFVLADRYLIPDEEARYYSEKPLFLPDCFQVNDRQRQAGALPWRSTYELADDALVFCAFNHNHKFSPELFATWMRILTRTPGSVLWLLADNECARQNLIAAAAAQGIESRRLIFAPRVPPTEYLARFQLADLFLDTLPFNGGTTASDALWMGLPLLTCSGRTFASRMAGSLLKAIGLPELITCSLPDYEELAVALAADRTRLGQLRRRLQENRVTHPLFDTPRFVKALEDVFDSVARRPPQLQPALSSQTGVDQ